MAIPHINVRSYWELAESVHPGPMRAYAAELAEYLARVQQLIGTDEHVCHVCGASNVTADGMARRPGAFYIGWGETFFCEQHQVEFQAFADERATKVSR